MTSLIGRPGDVDVELNMKLLFDHNVKDMNVVDLFVQQNKKTHTHRKRHTKNRAM